MNEKGKAKPRELKPSVKRLIIQRAITQRKVPREFLANQLIREIEESGEIPPTLETAKRYISKARNSDNPLDKPWTLGACREYPTYFPPSSLTFLMKCKKREMSYIPVIGEDKLYFSIRKAIWMVRLQPIIQNIIKPSNFEEEDQILFNVSEAYSMIELINEITGKETFDSSALDEALCSGNIGHILSSYFDAVIKTNSTCKKDSCKSCEYESLAEENQCPFKQKDGE